MPKGFGFRRRAALDPARAAQHRHGARQPQRRHDRPARRRRHDRASGSRAGVDRRASRAGISVNNNAVGVAGTRSARRDRRTGKEILTHPAWRRDRVLLVACVNLASANLARGAGRSARAPIAPCSRLTRKARGQLLTRTCSSRSSAARRASPRARARARAARAQYQRAPASQRDRSQCAGADLPLGDHRRDGCADRRAPGVAGRPGRSPRGCHCRRTRRRGRSLGFAVRLGRDRVAFAVLLLRRRRPARTQLPCVARENSGFAPTARLP